MVVFAPNWIQDQIVNKSTTLTPLIEADGIMEEVKGLGGVSVNETENERGSVTVVTTSDGTKVIDRAGGESMGSESLIFEFHCE